MNNYRNFLNESIYDIDILRELKLGDSLNKEIFTESRSMKKIPLPKGTPYGDPAKGTVVFAGIPGSFEGSKGGPAPAPAPTSKKLDLITETEVSNLLKTLVSETNKPADIIVKIGSLPFDKEFDSKNELKRSLSAISSVAAKEEISSGIILGIKILILVRFLCGTKLKDNANLGTDETTRESKILDMTFYAITKNSLSLHKKNKNFIRNYYNNADTKIEISAAHSAFSGKKIELIDTKSLSSKLESEIKKTYTI
jgi:hypothetical protein